MLRSWGEASRGFTISVRSLVSRRPALACILPALVAEVVTAAAVVEDRLPFVGWVATPLDPRAGSCPEVALAFLLLYFLWKGGCDAP